MIMIQHWFRLWLSAELATSHYLNWRWLCCIWRSLDFDLPRSVYGIICLCIDVISRLLWSYYAAPKRIIFSLCCYIIIVAPRLQDCITCSWCHAFYLTYCSRTVGLNCIYYYAHKEEAIQFRYRYTIENFKFLEMKITYRHSKGSMTLHFSMRPRILKLSRSLLMRPYLKRMPRTLLLIFILGAYHFNITIKVM